GKELIFEGAPEGIKFALGENTKRDRNPDRYPSTRMGVQDVIRQAFLDAKEYMREWDEYEQRRRRDRHAVPPRRALKPPTRAASPSSTRTPTAQTRSSCSSASPRRWASRSRPSSTCSRATGSRTRSPRTAPARPPSPTGGPTRSRPTTRSRTTRRS